MEYKKYKNIIKARHKAWLSDPSISRLAGISVNVTRNILFVANYKPSDRTLDRMKLGIDEFLDRTATAWNNKK